jgi:hypothetical protein
MLFFCAGAAMLAGASPVGCGGSEKTSGAKPPKGGVRSVTIEHEACDPSGKNVEALDTNGDGKPDIRRVYDGSKHELCRVADLNHDGKPDLYEYFDGSGAIRRREFCYDDTGVVNAVELYEGGKLVQRQYDTTGQHKIDTWDWFDPNAPIDAKTGRPVHPTRRERDIRGDGIIAQWWTWNGDKVSIATDRNGDGKPDPKSVIQLAGSDDAGTPTTSAASSTRDGGSAASPAASDDASFASAASSDGGKP